MGAGADGRDSVAGIQPLAGGITSAMTALRLCGGDAPGDVVLREMTVEPWRAFAPQLLRREAATLTLLEGTDVPAPTLIAVDPQGDRASEPSLLMTRLGGEPDRARADLDALAEMLVRIHSVVASPRPRAFELWTDPSRWIVPSWAAHPPTFEAGVRTREGTAAGGRLSADFSYWAVIDAVSFLPSRPSSCPPGRPPAAATSRTICPPAPRGTSRRARRLTHVQQGGGPAWKTGFRGTATGIRTPVSAVRGRRPSPLDDSGSGPVAQGSNRAPDAAERTRTSTSVRSRRPERRASTNSATAAASETVAVGITLRRCSAAAT